MKKSNHLLSKIKGDFIMEIAFCRIDDRLIHGQVATVWTKMTGCNRIMCVNDDVAQDEMRKKLLIQVAPPGIKAYVVPVDKAVAAYKDPKYDSFKTLFLFTNPADVVRAVKGGIPFKSVNLGGKCFKDGSSSIWELRWRFVSCGMSRRATSWRRSRQRGLFSQDWT